MKCLLVDRKWLISLISFLLLGASGQRMEIITQEFWLKTFSFLDFEF